MRLNQRGEGRGRVFFGLALFALAVYIAWHAVPVMIRVYAYEDKVREECRFLRGRTMDQLKKDLVEEAQLQKVPVTSEMIETNFIRGILRVDIEYTVPITTPFYVYNWDRAVHYDAPVFE